MAKRVISVVAVTGALCLGATAASAQTHGDASGAVPRTPWGDPDLQGVWDYRTITPMQRPAEFGDRAYYTDEEIAELEKNATERLETPPDTSVQTGLVHAVYITDPGTSVDESRRNSLIIDPPNGRMPELTAAASEAQARDAAQRGRARDAGPTDPTKPWLDRPLYERCITRGMPQAILPTL